MARFSESVGARRNAGFQVKVCADVGVGAEAHTPLLCSLCYFLDLPVFKGKKKKIYLLLITLKKCLSLVERQDIFLLDSLGYSHKLPGYHTKLLPLWMVADPFPRLWVMVIWTGLWTVMAEVAIKATLTLSWA